MKPLQKELNAIIVIAAREIVRYFKDAIPSLMFTAISPVMFLGLLGGSISQNLSGGLPYNYLQFALLGVIVSSLTMTTMSGVSSLVQDRENDFTQEIFVAPVSRYSIILGKIVGSSITSCFQLVLFALVILAMNIPLSLSAIGYIALMVPVICLSAGVMSVLIMGLLKSSPKGVYQMTMLFSTVQMFLCGAIIPVNNSSGILGALAHAMPMTYMVDLLRGLVYQGTPVYSQIVLYNPIVDLVIVTAFTVVSFVIGTSLFVRWEKNR
jgi:ABC-2 type transport system permease protein